jgi:hypothetical protein
MEPQATNALKNLPEDIRAVSCPGPAYETASPFHGEVRRPTYFTDWLSTPKCYQDKFQPVLQSAA